MNFSPFGSGATRSDSPALSSRASSPQPQTARSSVLDDPKVEKAVRRYAANIDRTLTTWEISPEGWADYIAFLSRLLKAIQGRGDIDHTLPHSAAIASKLAQCLNPGLPSGVHQKALEVYSYIFSTFGTQHVSACLDEYLPGLFPLLSFASLSVRPALYILLEDHVVPLGPQQLRPVLKSFILSLLPALEDDTSEDFDRALAIIVKLETSFCRSESEHNASDNASFFWQSVYLSIITSPSRRQGALNYLIRQSVSFGASPQKQDVESNGDTSSTQLKPDAEAAISPDPGLLIRAFSCGLSDSQMLIQRGFLDLLTTTLPLHSPVLQQRVGQHDLRRLLSAVMSILLRRDMSLNRRIWQWFLGPEPKDENGEPISDNTQLEYFTDYGMHSLQECLIDIFTTESRRPTDRVRPFRISLSLMDRWEIGGHLIPHIFLPAMRSAFKYHKTATKTESSELLRSVSLFFDGVESRLIWSNLFILLHNVVTNSPTEDDLQFLVWILSTFNVREEDMTTTYAPLLALYALNSAALPGEKDSVLQSTTKILHAVSRLINITSVKVFQSSGAAESVSFNEIQPKLIAYFRHDSSAIAEDKLPFSTSQLSLLLLDYAVGAFQASLDTVSEQNVTLAASICTSVLQRSSLDRQSSLETLVSAVEAYIRHTAPETIGFETLASILSVITTIDTLALSEIKTYHLRFLDMEPHFSSLLLRFIAPNNSKHNLEAVRMLWRVDSIFKSEDAVTASIQSMLAATHSSEAHTTSVRTFLNLVNLSPLASHHTAKSPSTGSIRRPSSSLLSVESDKTSRPMQVLQGPLCIVLDVLDDPMDPVFSDVSLWLNYSQHADMIVRTMVDKLYRAHQQASLSGTKPNDRRAQAEAQKLLIYIMTQINNVLKNAHISFWYALNETQSISGGQTHGPAVLVIARCCLQLLPGSGQHIADLYSLAGATLSQLLHAPSFILAQLQTLNIKYDMIRHVLACLLPNNVYLQPSMLRLAARVMSLQDQEISRMPDMPRNSIHHRKSSVASPPITTAVPEVNDTQLPIQELVQALQTAFSSPSTYPYLDAWLEFLADTVPTLGEAIITSLIPLTETICTQTEDVFEQVALSASGSTLGSLHAPETTVIKLLDALEIILRNAHDLLLVEEASSENSQAEPVANVLNSVTPNLFKQQTNSSKTAKANHRLTVILSSKDIVRICVRIYVWASGAAESTDAERSNAATISHVALRLRNRARHMLEGIFSIETMETLEVVASTWYETSSPGHKDAIMGLLQVLHVLRPKDTVPAILDALSSRTNASTLSPNRQSTLTSDLSPAALVLFYSAYLSSLEDDALDEIWADCTAFMKDILANPLPYRSILPMLLWIAFQLADKLDNTNFGDKKRMRRELGDTFQRLLTATFTTIPSGSIDVVEDRHDKETSFAVGLRELNLAVILREIVARAETLLETGDRVALSVNAITSHLVTPNLRSKTFPSKASADILALTVRIAKKLPSSKLWRRDVTDAFNDTRFIMTPTAMVERHWFPILQQLLASDKERMTEILSRLNAPSSAGIMFGVGANAARLDADRKTQLNLRRLSLLLLATPVDSQVEHLRAFGEKMVELFEATTTSSPSATVKAEVFMLIRALLLSTSPVHFAAFWPIVNDNLRHALLSLSAESLQTALYNNLSLLQACKLLDLLVALSPEEFQLHEWLFITNTTDAVYHPADWTPMAISDQLADSLGGVQIEEDSNLPERQRPTSSSGDGLRGPLLRKGAGYDTEDIKAMSRDVFVNNSLRPFLSQLSIHLYESKYRLEKVDTALFKHALIEDLQDAVTVIG